MIILFFSFIRSEFDGLAVAEEPEFTDIIDNVTVPAGRNVKMACSVKNLGSFKVIIATSFPEKYSISMFTMIFQFLKFLEQKHKQQNMKYCKTICIFNKWNDVNQVQKMYVLRKSTVLFQWCWKCILIYWWYLTQF